MVIAICESKEEDANSQILFWEQLNAVMQAHGYPRPDFAGFMADEAGANWISIRTVYNGGPDNILLGREHSCLFHWEQSLHKHTNKYVLPALRTRHIEMCENWRLAQTEEIAKAEALSMKKWWKKGCNDIATQRNKGDREMDRRKKGVVGARRRKKEGKVPRTGGKGTGK